LEYAFHALSGVLTGFFGGFGIFLDRGQVLGM
jgi:hypothetical protein